MFSLPNADYAYYGWKVALLEIETTFMKSDGTSLTEFREDSLICSFLAIFLFFDFFKTKHKVRF